MRYRREIDGLRAIAVLPVILFHAGFDNFSGGFVGVDIFFVISGYLITALILGELEEGKFSLANFFERRARRILPALFFVILVCIPFAWLWLLPSDMKDFSQSLVAVSVFASNIFFWRETGYFETSADLKPLLHTWSLAVEEQYYVLFPVFLLLFWRLGKRWILGALALAFIASIAAAQWMAYARPAAAFYLLPTRGWELLLGAFAAFYLSRTNRDEFAKPCREIGGWLGVALILYAVFAFGKATPFPGFYALVPTLGALLIILFSSQQTIVGRLIGKDLFVGIGLISYSAYLWHQPVLSFARNISINDLDESTILTLVATIFALSYFSWRYIETPFRSGNFFSRKHVFFLSLIFIGFFVTAGLIGHFSNGFDHRLDIDTKRALSAVNDKNPRNSECHFGEGREIPKPSNYCVLGSRNIVGMLLGDSHADALAHQLSLSLGEAGFGLLSVTYSGCPPIENLYRRDQGPGHQCHEINSQSFAYALNNPSIKYMVLVARWSIYIEGSPFDNAEGGVEYGDPVLLDLVDGNADRRISSQFNRRKIVKDRYVNSINKLIRAGKKVIIVYPVPEVGWDVPRTLAKMRFHESGADTITTSYRVFLGRNWEVTRLFDSLGDDSRIFSVRPERYFCNILGSGRCVTELDGKLLYRDDDHLSNAGARYVAEGVMKGFSL